MASINPSLHADIKPPTERGDALSDAAGGVPRRGAGTRPRAARRKSRTALRRLREASAKSALVSGWPAFDSLKPVLLFLSIPAFLVMAITVTGGHWPAYILYPIAIVLGLVVAVSAFRGVELVLALLLIYLPFSKVFVVPIAPGINGTNMLILLGLFAALLRLVATRQKLTDWPAGAYLVFAFAILSSASAFTITLIPGGRVYLLYGEILSYKAWVDQFVFYFIVLMCVRDTETAKRCIVYVMIGSVLVVVYSVPEMLEKMGRSTIEKSRIGGPHLQSNNFGGFVAYTILPLMALFIVYIKDVRAWLLTPYFLLTAKVLITTFSRGAYVAMVVGAFMAGWFKGKGFLAWWAAVGLSFILVFPSLIPESIVARMDTVTIDENSAAPAEDKLDQSSVTRLIMWRAAANMIAEDPIWGKGFKGFPLLKADYTEIPVKETDPHSMYLYIGSQMGLPALSLFLVILGYSFWLGRYHSKNTKDRFIKVIGIGGASATACFAVVCIFGSRAVSLNFTVYFWTFLVVMQVLRQKQLEEEAAKIPKRKRTNAFEIARQSRLEASHGVAGDVSRHDGDAVSMPGSSGHGATAVERAKGWQRQMPDRKARGAQRGAAARQAENEKSAQTIAGHAHSCPGKSAAPAAEHIQPDLPFVQRKNRRLKKRFSSI